MIYLLCFVQVFIVGAIAISDLVKTTMGPKGMVRIFKTPSQVKGGVSIVEIYLSKDYDVRFVCRPRLIKVIDENANKWPLNPFLILSLLLHLDTPPPPFVYHLCSLRPLYRTKFLLALPMVEWKLLQ